MLFLVIALLVFITQTLLSHWWLVMIDCFVAAWLVGKSSLASFLSGFLGVLVVWLGYALFVNSQNEGLLLGRISELLGLGKTMIIIITVLVGSLAGGMSALTGYHFKAMWKKTDE
jgi:hypothetical protein